MPHSIAVLHVHRSGILRLMGDEQDKIVPTDYVIESIKASGVPRLLFLSV